MSDSGGSDAKFALNVSEDRLLLSFEGHVDPEQLDGLLQEVIVEFAEMGISAPPPDELRRLFAAAAPRPTDVSALALVHGKAPVLPQDGKVQWARDFFTAAFKVDEATGIVDYRERQGDPSVEKDELLARVLPPVPGEDGTDVFGKRIAAGPGKTQRLTAGANVRASDAGDEFYATASGRVRYVPPALTVDPVYVVKGNVGLETGNIVHPGALLIEGDIESGADVRAQGDIEVSGIVESADVEAGGDLWVRRGITGKGKGPIRVAGSVRVRFVVESAIVAEQDVLVESEMVNSEVETRGVFYMAGGRVVGGHVQAVGGICVRQAGSEGLAPTRLSVVPDQRLAAEIAAREKRVQQLREVLSKLGATAIPLRGRSDLGRKGARETLEKLAGQVPEIKETIAATEAEIEELKTQLLGRKRPQIVIREVAYPETRLEIHNDRLRIMEPVRGPVRAVNGRDGVEFRPVAVDHAKGGA